MSTALQPNLALGSAHGALADQQSLIRLRHLARHLGRWQVRKRGRQVGAHASPLRGRGLSFHHVREYQGGDEIRHIDWRVTARTNTAHTKVFEEETERPVLVFVDQRQSMFFGSQRCFKSVLACHIMSLLAWAALESNDRIGGLIFNDTGHQEVRPRRSHRAVLRLIHKAVEYNHALAGSQAPAESQNSKHLDAQGSKQTLTTALEELRRINRPGSSVFLISDFHGLDEDALRQLHLLSRHSDVFALTTVDAMERELPASGLLSVSDGQQRLQLDIGQTLRRRFAQSSSEQRDTLAQHLRLAGIRQIELGTNESFLAVLQRELGLS